MDITVVRGDITRQDVEVVVTAANLGSRGGGGVYGAVHRAASPELLKACRLPRGGSVGQGPSGVASGLRACAGLTAARATTAPRTPHGPGPAFVPAG